MEKTNNIKDYESYIGKEVIGFKFNSQPTCGYTPGMDDCIGVVGTIVRWFSDYNTYRVNFGYGGVWYYPADLVIKQLEQKEELIEMLEKDEESGIYDDDSAEPIIKKGDIYRCIKDYTMERGNVAYKKGNYCVSEQDGCLTDEEGNTGHIMTLNNEFYEHFTKLERKNPYFVGESSSNKENDMVNNPSHYNKGGVECIEAIKSSMTDEAYRGYLKGSISKYLWRYESKVNPLEDLKKSRWFLDRLIKELENDEK